MVFLALKLFEKNINDHHTNKPVTKGIIKHLRQNLPHSCFPRAHHSCRSNLKHFKCQNNYTSNNIPGKYKGRNKETDQQEIHSVHLNMARFLVTYSAILLASSKIIAKRQS